MSDFWNNLYKFPRFLISVTIGFFLTTLQPIFKLLKNKKNIFIVGMTGAVFIGAAYKVIRKMTGLE
uniref:Uncharacterized protein ycf33 n=1 Tax=Alsidium seaforthii TaxID=2007182 RepID=A0A1Z1MDC6_9FLOR|nr:hypothetical protein [Bryothamnion seaforthii]ARW64020.1 hypothetical protein [Bryothamnion seaforthii]